MNILSLFDGMSCGQIALDQLGIKVDNYYAAEIDKDAIKIAKKNYPNTIHLGNVTKIKGSDLPKIDLLIGGSPCQGFSFAGKQLNFNDSRSALFFEFVRLLKETNPKYFLLENVKMKKEYENVISEYLGVKPITINSSLVSAQNRIRLYWTNITNVTLPEDKGIFLKDILENNVDEKFYIPKKYIPKIKIDDNLISNVSKRLGGYMKQGQGQRIYSIYGKSITLSALGGGWGAKTGLYETIKNGEKCCRKLTPIECERLQNVPDNYTLEVIDSQRYKMLGNGWTVEVIKHIFKGIEQNAK
jgi:DNA-cytosine methyltransferase